MQDLWDFMYVKNNMGLKPNPEELLKLMNYKYYYFVVKEGM